MLFSVVLVSAVQRVSELCQCCVSFCRTARE